MLEPVTVVKVVGTEQQGKRTQVLDPLEAILDQHRGDSIEGRGLFGRRAACGGLLGQWRHGVERVSISQEVSRHVGGGAPAR